MAWCQVASTGCFTVEARTPDDRKGARAMLKSLGRAALAAIFVLGGADALKAPGQRANKLDDAGIPQPELAVRVNGATMVLAGIVLALGIAPKAAAGTLLGSLIPTTLVGHPFWR